MTNSALELYIQGCGKSKIIDLATTVLSATSRLCKFVFCFYSCESISNRTQHFILTHCGKKPVRLPEADPTLEEGNTLQQHPNPPQVPGSFPGTCSHHIIWVPASPLPVKAWYFGSGPRRFQWFCRGFLSYFAPGGDGVGSVSQPQLKAELVCTHKAAQSQQVCEECLFAQTTGLAPDTEPRHATQHCQRS